MNSETIHELNIEELDQVSGGFLFTPKVVKQSLSFALALYRFSHSWDGFGSNIQKAIHSR